MIFEKPRLRYCRKTWDCRSATFPQVIGFGYSAKAAYDDWSRLLFQHRLSVVLGGGA